MSDEAKTFSDQITFTGTTVTSYDLWIKNGDAPEQEELEFPTWREMSAKQLEACVLACRDALKCKGPSVHILAPEEGARAMEYQLEDIFSAWASVYEPRGQDDRK